MMLMGDEIGRSQGGNNNAYCQDNQTTWMRWRAMSGRDFAFMEFVRGVIAIRRRYPVLRSPNFLHGTQIRGDGTRDVIWLRPDGKEMDNASWADKSARSIGVMLGDIPARVLDPHKCLSWDAALPPAQWRAALLARAHRRRQRRDRSARLRLSGRSDT